MKAIRIHAFGAPQVIVLEDIPRPVPGAGEVLIRIEAAGVGPWDALIRTGKSGLPQPLPLTLGSDIAGVVEAAGTGVSGISAGDSVFGVSNARFTDGYAEYSAASSAMIAQSPRCIDPIQAASLPVVAVTAWQMLFDVAKLAPGERVVVHGASGSVGRIAVQMARRHGLQVVATASAADRKALMALGAEQVLDARAELFERILAPVDAVIDLVGGDVQNRSYAILKPGGRLVSAVTPPDQSRARKHFVRASYLIVNVTTSCLSRVATMVDAGELTPSVGCVLPLAEARTAHEMLDGQRPRGKGKIVLSVGSAGQ